MTVSWSWLVLLVMPTLPTAAALRHRGRAFLAWLSAALVAIGGWVVLASQSWPRALLVAGPAAALALLFGLRPPRRHLVSRPLSTSTT